MEELKNFAVAPVPKHTKQATHWAVCVFDEWVAHRNAFPSNTLHCPEEKYTWLSAEVHVLEERIGVGVAKKRAPVFTSDAENLFWEREIAGFNTQKALLNKYSS